MKKLTIVILGLLTCVLMMNRVYAFNTEFLTFTPASYFTKEDTDLMVDTAYKALEQAKDGQKLSWSNPESGNSGYLIPSKTKGNCRHLKIFDSAQGFTSETQYKVCKANGEWKVIP